MVGVMSGNRPLEEMTLDVRVILTRHEELEAAGFVALAQDPVASVRRALAHREDLPSEIAEQFAADPDPEVRAAACFRPLSASSIAALQADPDPDVRESLLACPTLPPELLLSGLQDAQSSGEFLRLDVMLSVVAHCDLPTLVFCMETQGLNFRMAQVVVAREGLTPQMAIAVTPMTESRDAVSLVRRFADEPLVLEAIAEHWLPVVPLEPDLAHSVLLHLLSCRLLPAWLRDQMPASWVVAQPAWIANGLVNDLKSPELSWSVADLEADLTAGLSPEAASALMALAAGNELPFGAVRDAAVLLVVQPAHQPPASRGAR